eukprot:9228615-Pyramimonas_sp.AAC.1
MALPEPEEGCHYNSVVGGDTRYQGQPGRVGCANPRLYLAHGLHEGTLHEHQAAVLSVTDCDSSD